jgi:hypothetical protein
MDAFPFDIPKNEYGTFKLSGTVTIPANTVVGVNNLGQAIPLSNTSAIGMPPIGISNQSVTPGQTVPFLTKGLVSIQGQTFSPGKIFIDANGLPLQADISSGVVAVIGHADPRFGSNTFFFDPSPYIIRLTV